MSAPREQTTQRDWTKTLPFAALALAATLATTGITVYRTWKPPQPGTRNDFPVLPPVTTPAKPTGVVTPPVDDQNPQLPGSRSKPALLARHQRVCAEWSSPKSGKRYNFVCRKNGFDVYEVSRRGSIRIGDGRMLEDNSIETDLTVRPTNPNAPSRETHWKLKLSTDEQKLEGTHSGDDPRESFPLTLTRSNDNGLQPGNK